MNRILYTKGKLTIRLREIVLFLLVVLLVLVLFGLKGCQTNHPAQNIETLVKEPCKLSNSNLKDLDLLLKRSDLCSEEWFKDFHALMERVETQNKQLEKWKDKQSIATLEAQSKFLVALKGFDETQSLKEVDTLQKASLEYQATLQKGCN